MILGLYLLVAALVAVLIAWGITTDRLNNARGDFRRVENTLYYAQEKIKLFDISEREESERHDDG